jgi:hypothetical protein
MRVMEVPSFLRKIEIHDLGNLIRTRLSQTVVLWPEQSIPLLGYMCYPNDAKARSRLVQTLRKWREASRPLVPPKLGRIQHNWLRTADALHLLLDLIRGRCQRRRGGPSIGKAITLGAVIAKSQGTSAASFWKMWSTYKDVAHLVTAASLIAEEARTMNERKPFGSCGLPSNQLGQFVLTMLMPDLVIAVALSFEHLGLSFMPQGLEEPTLDRKTLWCIPHNINVVPLEPPVRRIRPQEVVILNKRRAGNRGKGKKSAARIAS